MTEIKSRNNLRKNLPNEFFTDEVVRLNTSLNNLLKIATLTVLHNDIDFEVAFVYYSVIVADYVRMLKFSQNIDFRNNLLLFFFIHFSVI